MGGDGKHLLNHVQTTALNMTNAQTTFLNMSDVKFKIFVTIAYL
jgi:hypothetical protein